MKNFYFSLTLLLFVLICFSYAQCPVVADFEYTRICNSGQIQFIDQSYFTGPGQIVSWQWNFGDGQHSSLQNPVHNYIVGSFYTVQLIVTDSSGCSDTLSKTIFVDPLPVASFTFTPNNACSGTPIQFSNNSTGSGLTYSWNFGDGSPLSNIQNPSHTYDAVGCGNQIYTATLTVTDSNGCTSTTSHLITVRRRPDILFIEQNGFIFCHTDTSNISDTVIVFNYSPSAGCISSYTVNWGDGGPTQNIPPPFDPLNPITHIYTHMGYYNVIFTAIGTNGCSTIDTQLVAIESNPVASIIGPPTGTNVGCAPMQVCITNNSFNISPTTTLQIEWGDGTTQNLPPSSVGDTICHIYHTSGCHNNVMNSYQITLTATNLCDFTQISWGPVRVFQPPQAQFIIVNDTICVDEVAEFINISIPNSCTTPAMTIYTWNFGDGNTFGPSAVPWGANPQQTVYHQFADTGLYNVTLIATNNFPNGCGSTQYQASIYVTNTYADFTFDTVCYGQPTHFTDLSWAPTGYITSWQWSFGDGYYSTEQNPTHIFQSWGVFYTCLIATSNLGCSDTICKYVIVDTLPTPSFTSNIACLGDTTFFSNHSISHGSPIISYWWNFGDGTTSVEHNPWHIYSNAGNYTVTLVVEDAKGCRDSIQQNVIVSPLPNASFTANVACIGNATLFQSTSSSNFGNITTYLWDFGDGSPIETTANPSHIYADTGWYNVMHIVTTEYGCTDTIIQPVYVAPYPQANFLFDVVCAGQTTHFTDTSLSPSGYITSWTWNFGDGNMSSDQNPIHIYPTWGTYNACLIVTNSFSCSHTFCQPIQVDTLPIVDFTWNTTCLGDTTFFINNSLTFGSSIQNILWDFGDGNTSSDYHPWHIYVNDGSYPVTLIVIDSNGCSDTVMHFVNVLQLPQASFTANTACYGSTTHFQSTSLPTHGTITSYLWDFGDGSPAQTGSTVTHHYADTGWYQVTHIITTSFGCTDTIMQPVYVSPYPDAHFSFDTVCYGYQTSFNDLSNGFGTSIISWTWNFNDQGSSHLQHPAFTFPTPGTHPVTLIISNNYGCHDTLTLNVHVDSIPFAAFSGNNVCFKELTHFTDFSIAHGSPIISWQWDFGDGNGSIDQYPSHLYTSPGSYQVTLIVQDSRGCTDTASHIINVWQLPSAGFEWQNVCFGDATMFTDTSQSATTITNWYWNFGDGTGFSTLQNPSYTYPDTGNYQVTLIITNSHNCKDTTTQQIYISPLPEANFSFIAGCANDTVFFTDLSSSNGVSINSWFWDFQDGYSSLLQNPSHVFNSPGYHQTTLIVQNSFGCRDTVTYYVHTDSLPLPAFLTNNVCFLDTAFFYDASVAQSTSIVSWFWSFGDGTFSNLQHTEHVYSLPGSYLVTLVVQNSAGCIDSISQIIEVYPLPQPDFSWINACVGKTIQFYDESNSVASIVNWHWDFGDGSGTSQVQNPQYIYNITDTFNVTLTIIDTYLCSNSTSIPVIISQSPLALFVADTVCTGQTTTFTDLSDDFGYPITVWNWNFGDGNTSDIQHPQHIYNNWGTYTAQLIVQNISNCADTAESIIFVKPVPQAAFTSQNVCLHDSAIFWDVSIAHSPSITNWYWDFGDGQTSLQQHPHHMYSNPGLYPVTLIIQNSEGCFDTITNSIQVYEPPLANFTASIACLGFPTYFQDLSTPQSFPITQWEWQFGDGTGSSLQQNPQYTYSIGTSPYLVTLMIQDAYGCRDTAEHLVTLHPQPVAHFSVNTACSQSATQFTDLSTPAFGTITSWQWDFGDGVGSSTLQNPQYTYPPSASATQYLVQLIVTDSNGCPDTVAQYVTVHPKPIAAFQNTTACNGYPTEFTDLSSSFAGNVIQWFWDFGDGSTSNTQHPHHVYPQVSHITQFPVTLIVFDDNNCSDTIIQSVQVNPLPIPIFSASTACSGSATYFTDLSLSNGGSITTWQWDFGDGIGTSSMQNPNYTYPSVSVPTNFQVILTVADDNNCIASVTQSVLVNPLPIANFAVQPTCSNYPVQFTDLSTSYGAPIQTWHWNFGDGSPVSNIQNPEHIYPTATVITQWFATLTVTDLNACSDTVTLPVTIIPAPVASFTPDTICSGQTAIFIDQSTSTGGNLQAWYWDFGDGIGTSSLQNPSYNYQPVSSTTSYPIQLIVENSYGCRDTIIQHTLIYSLPIVNFNASTACEGNPTQFTDLSNGSSGSIVSWLWNFGDGTGTSTEQHPSYIYNNYGPYQVSLTVTNDKGCSQTYSETVIVDSLPLPSFIWQPNCYSQIIHFTNTSSGNGSNIVSYHWDFGDGSFSLQPNPSHYYSQYGVYQVTLYVLNDRGCSNTYTSQITVSQGLQADFHASPVCHGEAMLFQTIQLNPLVPIQSWFWNFGDGNTSTQPDPSHIYQNAGTYNVMLIVSDTFGCTQTIIHPVTVYPNPTALFTNNTVQIGTPTTFTDQSTANAGNILWWQWDFGDGSGSNLQHPVHLYLQPGVYQVTLIVANSYGCLDTITLPVIVMAQVIADFIADTACAGSPTTFHDLSTAIDANIISWYWNFGNGYTSTQQHPVHVYTAPGIYQVTLIISTDAGTADTITKPVIVLESPFANFIYTEVCQGNPTSLIDFSSFTTYPIIQWEWQLGDGTSSNVQNIQHIFSSAGAYPVQLIVTNSLGCTDTIQKTVHVWQLPVVSFTAEPQEGCVPLQVIFYDNSFVNDGNIISWMWNFGDGFTSVAPVTSHTYPYQGIFDIQLTVVSNHGCSNSLTVPNMIQAYPRPLAYFSYHPSAISVSESISFIDHSAGATQWLWHFGDGTNSVEQNPIHYYDHPGQYTIVLIVGNQYQCNDTARAYLNVMSDQNLWYPNAITPNGDGMNDVFLIFGYGWKTEGFELRIFDRWGKQLFYTTDINQGWNGIDQRTGQKVPPGVYVWKIKAQDFLENSIIVRGIVTVIY